MSYIEIHTTQNIHIEYETASIGERFVAILIDAALLFAWVMLWTWGINRLGIGFSVWVAIVVGTPVFFYSLLCELLFDGQSAGKRFMYLRVAKIDGAAPSLGDYFLRWVFRLVDNLGVAVVCMMFTPKCQRLGDLAAKTCVVRTQNTTKPITIPELKPDHTATYATATQLSDHDAAVIAQIISNPATLRNKVGLKKLSNKVKAITQTQSEANDIEYLKKILEDYNHLAGRV